MEQIAPKLTEQIQAFENRYGYDGSYMHHMLNQAPVLFERFTAIHGICPEPDQLPAEAFLWRRSQR